MAIKNAKIRTLLKILTFALIGVVAIASIFIVNGERRYIYLTSVMTLLSLAFFVTGYEDKKTGTRRMVVVSILIALSVVGRFIPFFKPVSAISIISAIYLGSEAGFLTGSMSALISGFSFGIGPWTPFQMLAWGLVGFFAGVFSRAMVKSRALVLIYGVAAGIFFSLVMDVWTVLSYSGGLNLADYKAAFLSAIPHTLLYVVSNTVFLLLLERPIGKKLERVKIKYGI